MPRSGNDEDPGKGNEGSSPREARRSGSRGTEPTVLNHPIGLSG